MIKSFIQPAPKCTVFIVPSFSGKNWQDRDDKADKVSISFSRDSWDELKCFWGCEEEVRKIYHSQGGGGVKNYFFELTVSCLFMLYLIIVFNNVSGYFSKTWTWQWHIKCPVWCFQTRYHWLAEKNCQPLTCHLIEVTPPPPDLKILGTSFKID